MPDLDLDWELGLFKALRAVWRRFAPDAGLPYDAERAALLAPIQERLRVVASVVAGAAVRVEPARSVGGVRGRDLLLPPHIDLAPEPEANAGIYVLRAAVGGLIVRQRARVPADPLERFWAELRVAEAALRALEQELPAAHTSLQALVPLLVARRPGELRGRAKLQDGLLMDVLKGRGLPGTGDLRETLRAAPAEGPPCPPCLLWGRLVPVELGGAAAVVGPDETEASEDDDPGIGTELQAPPTEDLHLVVKREDQLTELPVHAFEKVETVEAFSGSLRQQDGADELEEHLEALEEVDLSHLIRGGPPVHSIYSAELRLGVDLPDVERIEAGEQGIPYDEWDGRKRRYLKDWCQVYPSPVRAADPGWAVPLLHHNRRLIDRLAREVEARHSRLRPARRQLDGSDVDIDALVDAQATLRAGHSPSRRLYIRRRRPVPELAVTVLLDLSLSADSWVCNRRVLDVTREATLVLGEVAQRVAQPLQVLAFASHTRNKVRVWGVCDWHEPWTTGRARLGALRPQGYTRIGPALRHAAAGLARVDARQRLLLLLTDGKPNDYDRYEGRHGVADVRRAIREAQDRGVHTHALAVDAVARDYLPQMLGPGAWSILPHPDALPEALSRAYARVA